MKSICHITSAHKRYDGRIYLKECISLAKSGFDVSLIVNDDIEDEVLENVNILSTRFKPKNRLERLLFSKRKLFKMAVEVDAEIYHFHDPDLIPIGLRLKRKNKKVIFDSHEDVPQQIKGKEWIPKPFRTFISIFYSIYENYSVKRFDAVISVTPHIVKRLAKINKNTVMVTNYPIIKSNSEVSRKPSNAVCFAGGISEQWNHEYILSAIEQLEGVEYILAGSGTKDYIEILMNHTGWKKTIYKGLIEHSEVNEIYSSSFAGLALNSSIQAKQEGSLGNTKLFEYMYAELPVICSDFKLWKEIIEQNHCGICVDPNNIEEIRSAIAHIKNNQEEAKTMGENGRKAVFEKYNWGTQEKILIRLYDDLLN